MAHNKRPWKIDSRKENDKAAIFINDKDGYLIAIIPTSLISECSEQHDNAHLIAAAPELLEALEGLVNSELSKLSTHDLMCINKVIDKAKGEL